MSTFDEQVSAQTYPHLFGFLAGYFGEDWREAVVSLVEDMEDTLEPEEYLFRRVIATYVAKTGPEEVVAATTELEKLLDLPLGDEQLQSVVTRNLGCYYSLETSASYRKWLKAVRGQLCVVRPRHVR